MFAGIIFGVGSIIIFLDAIAILLGLQMDKILVFSVFMISSLSLAYFSIDHLYEAYKKRKYGQ